MFLCVLVQGQPRVWKWFDDRTGKWTAFSDANNKTIDDAFSAGDSVVQFVATRRKYSLNFSTMVQVNDETGNRRAVMIALPPPKKEAAAASDASAEKVEGEKASDVTKSMSCPSYTCTMYDCTGVHSIQTSVSFLVLLFKTRWKRKKCRIERSTWQNCSRSTSRP